MSNYGPPLEIAMPNINLTTEQLGAALNAGLALTNPESDLLEVFRKHAAGVLLLRSLLGAISNGAISLGSTLQEDPAPPGDTPPGDTPPGDTPQQPPNKGPAPKRGARKSRKPKKK